MSEALSIVEQAAELGNVGVSYSGGKDSTVTLDLVRRIVPTAPAAFFDCGCELPTTEAMVDHYGAQRVKTQQTLKEMCRYGGYWGYEHPTDAEAEFAFFDFLVAEPSQRFVEEHQLTTIAMGLRAQESGGRAMSAWKRGRLYRVASGEWHLCPLAFWSDSDVWAYIADRHLVYNEAYDRMAELRMPRRTWRIGMLLGLAGARTEGRYAWLRQMYPGVWNELVGEFPKIANYT